MSCIGVRELVWDVSIITELILIRDSLSYLCIIETFVLYFVTENFSVICLITVNRQFYRCASH